MYIGEYRIDDYVTLIATTHRFSSGAAYAPTAITYRVYEDATDVEIVADTAMTNFDAETGFYLDRIQCTAVLGYEVGKTYTALIKATVDSVAAITAYTWRILTPPVNVAQWLGTACATPTVNGVPEVDLTHIEGTAHASTSIRANLISILGTTLTETAGQIAAAFKQFFDIGTPTGNMKAITNVVTATNLTTNNDKTGYRLSATKTTLDALNDISTAQVNTEVDTALADANLDHLAGTATGIPAIPAGTYIDQMMDDGTAVYDRTTDSLQAVRDRGDAAWTTGAGGSDRLLMVDTTIATLASQTSFTLTAGSADDNAYLNCTIVIEDVSTATQKAVGLISAYTGATKTVTLKYDPAIFTMAATDKVYILAENSLKSTAQNRQLDVTATGASGIDWGNVENPTTVVDLSATDIQLCDTTTTNTDMRGTDDAATAIVCTETRLGELDAATSGKMANQVDVIEVDITAKLDAAISTRATPAQVNTEVLDVLNTDTFAEPGQEAPGATVTLAKKIGYLYKAFRNKFTQDATTAKLYADDGTTVDQKSTVSDDATTFTRGEMGTGP